MAENQIKNLTESLAKEKARCSELEIEMKDLKGCLSCRKENSSVNEDCFFAKEIGIQQIDDVCASISCNASSSSVDNCQSQGLCYQVS